MKELSMYTSIDLDRPSAAAHARRTWRSKAAVTSAALTAITGIGLGLAEPASADAPTSYTVSSHSQSWNGGCEAWASVTYYPNSDTAVMNSTVRSPYLFAACRLRTHLQVQGEDGVWEGADQFVTACAVLDPTCASTISTGDQTLVGQTPGLTAELARINKILVKHHQEPLSGQDLVTGVSISFSQA